MRFVRFVRIDKDQAGIHAIPHAREDVKDPAHAFLYLTVSRAVYLTFVIFPCHRYHPHSTIPHPYSSLTPLMSLPSSSAWIFPSVSHA